MVPTGSPNGTHDFLEPPDGSPNGTYDGGDDLTGSLNGTYECGHALSGSPTGTYECRDGSGQFNEKGHAEPYPLTLNIILIKRQGTTPWLLISIIGGAFRPPLSLSISCMGSPSLSHVIIDLFWGGRVP